MYMGTGNNGHWPIIPVMLPFLQSATPDGDHHRLCKFLPPVQYNEIDLNLFSKLHAKVHDAAESKCINNLQMC